MNLRPLQAGEEATGFVDLIDRYAEEHGVPKGLARALFKQESSFNPKAVNAETGATGLGQLMSTTAEGLGVKDRTDPEQNIRGSIKYLREAFDREGTTRGALQYYYGGPDKSKWGPRTRKYPDEVLRHADQKDRATWSWAEKAKALQLRPYDPAKDEETTALKLRPYYPATDATPAEAPPALPGIAAPGMTSDEFNTGADAPTDPDKLSTLPAAQLASGVATLHQAGTGIAQMLNARLLGVMDRIDAGEYVPEMEDGVGYQHMDPAQRQAIRDQVTKSLASGAQTISLSSRAQASMPKNEAAGKMIEAANEKKWGEAWQHFAGDPLGVLQQLSLESAPLMAPSVILGLPAAITGGLPGFMMGMASGSFPIEYGAAVVEALNDAKVDMTSPAAVEAAFRDPEFVKKTGQIAVTRGMTIAAADALGAKLTGPLRQGALKANLKTGARNVGAEVSTEMGGELGAQVLSGQDVKFGEVLAEGLGAFPNVAVSTAGRTIAEGAKPPLAEVAKPAPVQDSAPFTEREQPQDLNAAPVAETATNVAPTATIPAIDEDRAMRALADQAKADQDEMRFQKREALKDFSVETADTLRKGAQRAAELSRETGERHAARRIDGVIHVVNLGKQEKENARALEDPADADAEGGEAADTADAGGVEAQPPAAGQEEAATATAQAEGTGLAEVAKTALPLAAPVGKARSENAKRAQPVIQGDARGAKFPADRAQGPTVPEEGDSALNVPRDGSKGSAVDAAISKGGPDALVANAKTLGNSSDADTLAKHGYGALDVPGQARVLKSVLSLVDNDEVFRAVVSAIPVSVMNDLVGKELSAEDLLNNKAMLVHALATNDNLAVRGAAIDAIVASPTIAIAKIPVEDKRGFAEQGGTATAASNSDGHDAATSPYSDEQLPTDAQKEAGNYKHGHIRVSGLNISVENPIGSFRTGVGPDGKAWSTKMQSTYGYIRRSEAKDGDHVDAFVKPGTPEDFAGTAFVIDQVNEAGKYDEAKVMLGFDTEEEARAAYLENFTPGWKGLGAITAMPMERFKAWVSNPGLTKKPAGTLPVRWQDWTTGKGEVKTFKSAEHAARFQDSRPNIPKNYTPRQTEDGWVLSRRQRDPSPAQQRARAAMQSRRRTVQPADSLGTAIAKLGGLKRSELLSDGVDEKGLDALKSSVLGLPVAPKTGGRSLDSLAEALAEYGFPVLDEEGRPDATALRELLDDELQGHQVYSPEGHEIRAEKAKKGEKPAPEFLESDILHSGIRALDEAEMAAVAEFLDSVEDVKWAEDDKAVDETVNSLLDESVELGRDEGVIAQYLNGALDGRPEDQGRGNGQGDDRAGEPAGSLREDSDGESEEDRTPFARRKDAANAQGGGELALKGETEAEIREREEREKTEAPKREEKAIADRERGAFALQGQKSEKAPGKTDDLFGGPSVEDVQKAKPAGKVNAKPGQGTLFARTKKQVNTPAFKAWFKGSKVVDENKKPLVVYHGTTMDFSEFDPQRGNIESDFGAGLYFTNTRDDVAENYAGMGPDLTQKVEQRAERIMQDLEDEAGKSPKYGSGEYQEMMAEARRLAKEEFAQHEGATMPVYLAIKKPFIVGGERETMLDYEPGYNYETEEQEGPESGALVDFVVALRNIASRYDDGEVDGAIGSIMDEAYDGDIAASRVIEIIKADETFGYYTDENGKLSSNEIVRQAIEAAGFDGIIDRTVDAKFGSQKRIGRPMAGMDYNTVHYIAFRPEQVKSAVGNRGTFDPASKNILFARFESKDNKRGLPQFWNERIALSNPRLNRLSATPDIYDKLDGGAQLVAFDIIDVPAFKAADAKTPEARQAAARAATVGRVLLRMRGREFVALNNIEIDRSHRKKGHAEAVVASMLQSQDAPVRILDIQQEAVDFWVKMGAKFPRSQDYMEASLDQHQYAAYQRKNARGLGRPDGRAEEGVLRPGARGAEGAAGRAGRDGPADLDFTRNFRDQAPERGLRVSEVEAVLKPIAAAMKNAPRLKVIGSMEEAPAGPRKENRRQIKKGATGSPYAFLHDGTAYIVANALDSPHKAITGFLHESIGHYGLAGVFGDALKPILSDLAIARRDLVVAKAREYGLDIKKRADLLLAAEEVLAEMAQSRPTIGFVRRAIAAIRSWLRSHGVSLKLTDDEIVAHILIPARDFVEKGKRAPTAGGTRFHRAPQTDSPAFKAWFGDSKVVDADGKPMVVYHGTGYEIGSFDGREIPGWFAESQDLSDRRYARSHSSEDEDGPNIIPVYLSIKRPLDLTTIADMDAHMDTASVYDLAGLEIDEQETVGSYEGPMHETVNHYKFMEAAREKGYDGILVTEDGVVTWAIFDPRQAKSAIGNNGDFDATNPDIRFSRGPAPTWYSELTRQVSALKQSSAPAAQWIATIKSLKGVKADEIEWSGVTDWLATRQGKVTKDEVLAFLEQNGVKVEEKMLGGEDRSTNARDRLVVELDALGFSIDTDYDMNAETEVISAIVRRGNGKRFAFEQGEGFIHDPDEEATTLPERVLAIGRELAEMEYEHPYQDGSATRFSQYTLPGGKNYRELLLTLPKRQTSFEDAIKNANAARDNEAALLLDRARLRAERDGRGDNINNDTINLINGARQPSSHDPLPAGDDGKFLSFEAVNRAREYVGAQEEAASNFRSSHFDTPNILAHVRFDERTDADGAKVLFVEELQSDWSAKGRRDGFAQDTAGWTAHRLNARDAGFHEWEVRDATGNRVTKIVGGTEESAIRKASEGIPRAPFVEKTDAWLSLALKRVIKYAVDNGFERVAFTTGEQQADRYSLRHQVNKIQAFHRDDGKFDFMVFPKGGGHRDISGVDRDKLADTVGKDLAAKIAEQPQQTRTLGSGKWITYEGLDLEIGGEGMIAFYDSIVPNVANDVLKKLGGGRVGTVDFGPRTGWFITKQGDTWSVGKDTGIVASGYETRELAKSEMEIYISRERPSDYLGTQPGFDITPSMVSKASEGMPLFARKPGKSHKAKYDPAEYGERHAALKDSGGTFAEKIADIFHSDKRFNWWHRSIGTQYHKAQVNKYFKRVYDRWQLYLREMSRVALDAANQAPNLLPQITGFKDAVNVFKGASQSDIRAIASPILEGTLQVPDDPHQGRVWKDAELRDQFKLTPKQIGLYREFRAAVDHSLDEMLAAEVANFIRKEAGSELLSARLRANPGKAGEIAGDWLAERAQEIERDQRKLLAETQGQGEKILKMEAEIRRLADLATDLYEKQQAIESLKAHGYAPLMRFGKYTVAVYEVTENGERGDLLYFSMHEKQREANKARRAAQERYPDAEVVSGINSELGFQLLKGLTPDTLEIMARTLGVADTTAFKAYIKAAKGTRSAMKRLLEREGYSGFGDDITRILAAFVTSNARAAASNWHMGELRDAVDAIPKEQGDVKDEAVRLTEYLQNPQEEAAWLRGFLFVQFLGGSIAAAAVNMTQPLTMTFPYLSQWGAKRAAEELGKAMLQVSVWMSTGKDVGLSPELLAALKRGEEEGIVAPHEIHQLHAEAMRRMGGNLYTRRLLTAWGGLFSAAEAFNRRTTFIAAYNIARQDKMPDAYAFAVKAVEETQGVYNRGNRPNWARGTIGSTVMTFKQFSISYLEFLKRLPPGQRALALAVLFLLSGAQGLPGAEDLEDLIDTIAQSLGYSFNSRQELRRFAEGTLGRDAAQFLMHGASHLPGVPLDVQGRLGMGNLIPGSSVLKISADKGREASDVLGPAGKLGQNVVGAIQELGQGNPKEAAKKLVPVAVQNILKAADMWDTGMYRDSTGKKVMDTTKADAIVKGIGFQPQKVAVESKKVGEQMQNIDLVKKVEADIAGKWAQGQFERGIATTDAQTEAAERKIDEAKAKLHEWNHKNPDSPIRVNQAQVTRRVGEMRMERDERLTKRAPPEIRRSVREALE